MLTKIYTVMALAIAIYILHAAYTNRSALVLRQQTQPQYNPVMEPEFMEDLLGAFGNLLLLVLVMAVFAVAVLVRANKFKI